MPIFGILADEIDAGDLSLRVSGGAPFAVFILPAARTVGVRKDGEDPSSRPRGK
jgi:hypothetical protein